MKSFERFVLREFEEQLSRMKPKDLRRRLGRALARRPNRLINWNQIINKNDKRVVFNKLLNKLNSFERMANIEPLKSCPKDKQLEQIFTTIIYEKQLCHLVKWKATPKCDLVVNTALNLSYPQQVIRYYRKNLKFI